jgi:hypothetical protein
MTSDVARLHVLVHATLEGKNDAITETAVFEGEGPAAVSRCLVDWLRNQAAEVERGIIDGSGGEAA